MVDFLLDRVDVCRSFLFELVAILKTAHEDFGGIEFWRDDDVGDREKAVSLGVEISWQNLCDCVADDVADRVRAMRRLFLHDGIKPEAEEFGELIRRFALHSCAMAAPLRVVFAGTPDFAVPSLTALLTDPRFAVIGVFTQPDRPAGRRLTLTPPPIALASRAAGVPVYQPVRLDAEALAMLRALEPDFLVVAAYGLILSPEVLAVPRIAPVNVHASLLPRWRGASPIQAAILAGDTETGIAYMKMEAGLDTGPTYAFEKIVLDETEHADELTMHLARLGSEKLPDVLVAIAAGKLLPIPQNDSCATICRKVKKADGDVDFTRETADEIFKKWRAYQPWPGLTAVLKNVRLKLIEMRPTAERRTIAEAGSCVYAHDRLFVVAADGGVLEVLTVQPEGKRAMAADEWWRGLRI